MKRHSLLIFMLLCLCQIKAQNILPEFSTIEDPVWYFVQFNQGNGFLTDQGRNQNLKTAVKNGSKMQRWQLIGDQSNFKMRNEAGNYITSKNGFFRTEAQGMALELIVNAYNGAVDCWEIQRKGSGKGTNQWGGAGIGKELGEWETHANNAVRFLGASIKAPQFSNDKYVTWYFIQFQNGHGTLEGKGYVQDIFTREPDPCNEQLWKLSGTRDSFQLINKDGKFAVINAYKTLKTSSVPQRKGFQLIESTSTYAPAWEIQLKDKTGYCIGQVGNGGLNTTIHPNRKGNNNNPVSFVLPEMMTYNDYEVKGSTSYRPKQPLTLWYTAPATIAQVGDKWMEYFLPIGNGQLGACISGGVWKEEVQFNEKTLCSGRSIDNGVEYGDYENFGSLFIESLPEDGFSFGKASPVQDYYRTLDLTTATAKVHFKSTDKSTTYTREYFTSFPDDVVAMKLTADKKGKMNLRFTLKSGEPGVRAKTTYHNDKATFGGKLETVTYRAVAKVVPTGGTMTTDEKGITVKGADEVLVILKGATDFDPYSPNYIANTDKLDQNVADAVDAAATKGWDALYADHLPDYQQYFNRTTFTLNGAVNKLPTDKMIDRYQQRSTGTEDFALMLEQLYFYYGRYLTITSSRGVDLPSNLQGIWNNSSEPAWNCDIHADVNVQMNYWPVESTNLSELHMRFINYVINMATNHTEWKKYAKDSGQTKGWTTYAENNIFGGVGSWAHNTVIANAWFCSHLWQHYRYTLDKDYLERALPTMWGACEYWLQRMKRAKDGTYVCPNELSPEHGPFEDGVAHSQQLVWNLFDNTLEAATILGSRSCISAADLALLKDRHDKMDKGLGIEIYDGGWGANKNGVRSGDPLLREWKYSNYSVGENGHRHMSHLVCLYPLTMVPPSSPYFEAAVNAVKFRGDASTGWSMGWKMNLWARALNGDRAHNLLELALRHHSLGGGGVYYNLFNSHEPFQIDGNFGVYAGISEMLLQSQTDTLMILPALPSVWRSGSITGLKAIGDFTVDIAWDNLKASKVKVVSNQGQPLTINAQGIAGKKVTINDKEAPYKVVDKNTISIDAQTGDTVCIDFKTTATHIAHMHTATVAAGTYHLNGCRLTSQSEPLTEGIYIVDGKKTIIH